MMNHHPSNHTHHVSAHWLSRHAIRMAAGCGILLFSLGVGVLGYRHFEQMRWVDAFLNASMILSGMGPASPLETDVGKWFAGMYALFSGIIFLVAMALIFGPILRRFFHRFHLDEPESKG